MNDINRITMKKEDYVLKSNCQSTLKNLFSHNNLDFIILLI